MTPHNGPETWVTRIPPFSCIDVDIKNNIVYNIIMKKTERKPVRIYLRVSTNSQGEDGYGIQNQLDVCTKYAEDHGLEIVGVYKDVISGDTHPNDRRGLSRLLKDLRDGDEVLVFKRCRMSREMYLGMWIDKEVQRIGGNLVSTEGANGNDPTQELMRNVLAMFAQFEKSMIRERTTAALRKIKESGRPLGRPPFGFSYSETGDLVKNENFPTVKKMRHLRNEGMNFSKISRSLNSDDLKSQTGKDFTPQMVRNILTRMEQDANLQEVA